MLKKLAFLAALAVAATTLPTSEAFPTFSQSGFPVNEKGIVQIGKTEPANIHVRAGVSSEHVISYPGAQYIAVRFDSFNLPERDEVVIRNRDFSVAYTYSGKGRNGAGAFFATFVPNDEVIVQYISRNKEFGATNQYGFKIPAFARGLAPRPIETICGRDDSRPAKCFQNGTLYDELPLAYERAKAVARLLINGTSLCTGWLAGSEGHMITNHHCIDDPALVDNTDIEFEAESASCQEECKKQLGCKGTIVTSASAFVTNNQEHDYAVVKLPESLNLKKYGFLQLREDGPVIGEEIYIPQHPVGWAKRIASKIEGGENAYIQTVHGVKTCGNNQVGYAADTQGGSSGSPVLAWADNYVVSLHHCGGCENQGVDIRDVIADLRQKKIVIKDLIIPSTASPAPTTPAPTTPVPTTVQPTPAPTTAQPTPAPTTLAPTAAPTPKPHMCHKFTTKLSCQFWFWCNWDKSRQACEPRF
ncbi:hypothetical protein PINS_up010140 [Pythium insidiosum]|nr:hypothetical protein PINS_up010140 [Pythium insidiosum]